MNIAVDSRIYVPGSLDSDHHAVERSCEQFARQMIAASQSGDELSRLSRSADQKRSRQRNDR
jgi:hypothetical protein